MSNILATPGLEKRAESSNESIFKPEIWQQLIDQTESLSKPLVIKDVLDQKQILDFKKATMDVIRFICENENDAYGFRVYIDGEKKNRDYLKQHIFTHIPSEGDDGTEWVKETFEDQKFGIILNTSEKFSLKIAESLSRMIEPLIQTLGIPSSGLHTTTFIGNYGFTPLGIHQDHPGANVIHFHLGPGEKRMYIWAPSNKGIIEQNDQDIEKHLPNADIYNFGEGDLFFMPWDQFHIGYTEGYSIALTLWFDNHSNRRLIERVFSSVKSLFSNEKLEEEITSSVKDVDNLSYENIDRILQENQQLADMPFKDLLKIAYSEYKMALFSNRGWRSIPLSLEQENQFDVNSDYQSLKGKDIKACFPFKVYYNVNEDETLITLYSRGSKVEMRYHAYLQDIIERLNSHELVNTDELLENLNTVWPEEAGLYFLGLLYDKRGFNIIDTKNYERTA